MSEALRVLVIGLDGATFDALGPLVERGALPNLAALMKKGCWGRLTSTIPPFTAAAWSSFITGKNPGQHGVISFRKRDRFNYDVQGSGFVDARRFDKTLWEILSAAQRRVGIVNVPLTFPARPVNGYMVTGMLTPPQAEQFTYPPEFVDRLGEDYVIDVDFVRDKDTFRMTGFPPKAEMLAKIRHMSESRVRVCVRLLQETLWDFFMVVFTSTDRVLHFFWDDLALMIDDQPGDGGANTALQKQIWAYFRALDDGVGELVRRAGPSTIVLVISDHGFGPAPTRRFYVNVWLEHLGLLQRRRSEGLLDLEHWRVMIGRNRRLKAVLRRFLPDSAQDKAKKVAESASKEIVDWSRTRAFFVPVYFQVCGVEINRAGMMREGIVESDAEYESLRDQIISQARALRDPQTGEPIVEMAIRREEIYHGDYVQEFPDVILVLDPDYICAASLAGISLVEPHSPNRPGEHRQDGIFIAAGPAISCSGERQGLSLVDVPSTVLYALGEAVPSSFDGRVLTEIFDPAYLDAHPVLMQDDALSEPLHDGDRLAEGEGYSEDEEAAIAERLRGLGYLD